MPDFIDPGDTEGSPSYYSGWYAGQMSVAKYLRDNQDGAQELLTWEEQEEIDAEEDWKRMQPYRRLLEKVTEQCKLLGHKYGLNMPCLVCMDKYREGSKLIKAMGGING